MRRTALIAAPIASLAIAAGLALSPASTPATADTSASTNTAHPGPHYRADTVHSSLVFQIKHAGVTNFYGRFNGVTGEFNFNPDDLGESHFEATIDLESVDTASERRDNHLKGPDFFNVRQFPEATFESTSIRRLSGDRYEVTGEFSLHGVTREITGEMEYHGTGRFRNNDIAAFEARLSINRSDFGITQFLDNGMLGDEVEITVAVEGVKQDG
mgnify:CR=1 FL=1